MTVDQHELYVTRSGSIAPAEGAVARFRRMLAPQDYVVFAYLCFLNVAVLSAPSSAARTASLGNVLGLLVLHATTLLAIRTGWLKQPLVAGVLYRLVTYGCVQITYFMFAKLLPLVNPRALDHELYQLDLTLFGVEPAVYLDRFVNPITTEWFAFFYFGYFFLLAIHVLPILFASRNVKMMSEFAMGMILLFCIGHTLYVFVPGYGPYKAMPQVFEHDLSQGIWWNTTRALVATSGAQKDIFPSLHTAAPTFLLLFSFHRRSELPFRYTWPLVAFFGANIVIATMFLRWHYVIDVVFGLLLAVTAHTLAVRLTERDNARRDALGLGPSWPQWPGGKT
ncbi:MAG TPA: phosphatase PAP2 family protein [Polyangiaceae bacterium]|nr:phosphatase PAP2 family protein [Polyangiaceae bacterium]